MLSLNNNFKGNSFIMKKKIAVAGYDE